MSIIAKDGFKLIQERDKVFCDSRELAKQFEKSHDKVVKDIEREIRRFESRDSASEINDFFIKSEYGSRGKTYKRYKLTFLGFQMISLQFTGDKAFDNRLKFLRLFEYLINNIQHDKIKALENSTDAKWLQFREDGKKVHTRLTDTIKKYVVDYRIEEEGKINDGRYYQHYADLINKKLGIILPKGTDTRNVIDERTLFKLEMIEDKISELIVKYAESEMHYKDVYKKIKNETNGLN